MLITFAWNIQAQFRLQGSTELGHTNVSEGMYLRSMVKGSYSLEQFRFQLAIQNELVSNNCSFFSGINMGAHYHFKIKTYSLQTELHFKQNVLNNYVNERNYIGIISTSAQKLNAALGLGFKTIGFTPYARKQAEINSNKSISEIFNLIYDINYSFLNPESAWKLKIGISNIDEFTVNQATNPMTFINARYCINDKLELTTEACYKKAGAFNLHVNYYGFYIRPGIIWKIN